jgi:translation initiation factor 1
MPEVCPNCGLPKELCVCETIAKETQEIRVYIEKKKFRKEYTIIEGINKKEINIKDMAKKLKSFFACGGTAKEGVIELQGNHIRFDKDKEKFRDMLVQMGFAPDTIKIK